jgi:hypothetical protein
MSVEVDLAFPHDYECELLDELPGGGSAPRHFFPGDRSAGQDGLNVKVEPRAHPAWIGTFASGVEVRATPVTDVRVVPHAAIVLFASYTDIVAHGRGGVRWRTTRISSSNLQIIAVGDYFLVGEYRVPSEGTRRFEVDLETGKVRGGVQES